MQNQNHGQKMAYYEGEDGFLYYNFALGLKVVLRENRGDTVEEYTLEIVGCLFCNGTEYYEIERDGVKLPYAQSANRVKFLLSRYGVLMLAEGERLKLPLIIEEVENYYKQHYFKYVRACRKAKEIPEYEALTSELRGLHYKIGMALAYERTDEVASLKRKRLNIECSIEKILRLHEISPADLEEQKCEKCDGKGVGYFGICECALAQSDQIKAFCAAERIQLRRFTGGNRG